MHFVAVASAGADLRRILFVLFEEARIWVRERLGIIVEETGVGSLSYSYSSTCGHS